MNVEQHEKALKELLKSGLSREEMLKEVNRLLGNEGFLFDLKEFLQKSVNNRISYKMKERYNGNPRGYFELRERIEEGVIFSSNWFSYFENDVSLEDLNQTMSENFAKCPFDQKTLMLIVIQALKSYVDNGQEENLKCLLIRNIYLNLKTSLSSEIENYPQEDGFTDYLATKPIRENLETARFSGEICIHCGSREVTSYGTMWKCRTCGRTFRKHRA